MQRWLLSSVLLLAVAPSAFGQAFTYTRIAQSGDIPTGASVPLPSNFASGFPALHSNGQASFTGDVGSPTAVPTVFTGSGGLPSVLVANGSPIPEGGGAVFLNFGASTGNGAAGVVFHGANAASSPTLQGMYLASGGTVSRIADTTTTVPGVGTPFTVFSTGQVASVDGANIAFRGQFTGGSGLYARFNGSLVSVADTNGAIPAGVGNFTSLTATSPVINGANVVFRGIGASSQQGIYLRDLANTASSLIRVTDKTLPLPGLGTTITTLFDPAVNGNNIRLIASSGAGTARVVQYAWNGSFLTPTFVESVLTKAGDTVPEQPLSTFTGYGGFIPSDGANFAVLGNFNDGQSRSGLYWHDGTTMYRVIDTTQTLDGKSISNLLLGPDAMFGNSLAFQATFTDGTRGIYVGHFNPVPEPASVLGLSALAGAALALLKRGRESFPLRKRLPTPF